MNVRSCYGWDAALVLGVLGADYGLKSFAARAGTGELDWLLAPTAALVSRATGHAFVAEAGAGYVSRELFVVIAPVCSGANFLIVAFTALACGFCTRITTPARKGAWLCASAVFAYCLTLGANSLRIVAALALRRCDLRGVLAPASAHRALGIAVYLGCLLAAAAVTARLLRRAGAAPRATERFSPVLVPLASYFAVTVVTPLLRGAGSRAFVEHTSMIAGAAGSTLLVLWLCAKLAAGTRRIGRASTGRATRTSTPSFTISKSCGATSHRSCTMTPWSSSSGTTNPRAPRRSRARTTACRFTF